MYRALHLERNARIKFLFLKFMSYSPLQVLHVCIQHSILKEMLCMYVFLNLKLMYQMAGAL